MAKFSPFAARAGMRRVTVQEPWRGTVRIADALSELGFDLRLLGSQRYVREKLLALSQKQISVLKDAIAKTPQPRLKKEITELRHVPLGSTAVYAEAVWDADLQKLARFARVAGMLLQGKVYLFWSSK